MDTQGQFFQVKIFVVLFLIIGIVYGLMKANSWVEKEMHQTLEQSTPITIEVSENVTPNEKSKAKENYKLFETKSKEILQQNPFLDAKQAREPLKPVYEKVEEDILLVQ